jgi:V-type H+-transporting ATPase subunit a
MFGDIAHGSLLMLFGIWLIFKKSTDNQSIIGILTEHKYLIFLMGFFATYCGFIYNDFLSISLDIFGTCYSMDTPGPNNTIPRKGLECVYPVGVDPVWSLSQNYLNYVNSLKMKIAVIIGVVHMTLGVFIKAGNAAYFKKWVDFFFEFLPQLFFMVCLFGYMDFLIVYKWLKPWQPWDLAAPSIITTMINFGLKLGQTVQYAMILGR